MKKLAEMHKKELQEHVLQLEDRLEQVAQCLHVAQHNALADLYELIG